MVAQQNRLTRLQSYEASHDIRVTVRVVDARDVQAIKDVSMADSDGSSNMIRLRVALKYYGQSDRPLRSLRK